MGIRQFKIGVGVHMYSPHGKGATVIANFKKPDENGNDCLVQTFYDLSGERRVCKMNSRDLYPYTTHGEGTDSFYIDEEVK